MTNAAAAIPLTYDGTDLQEASPGIFLEIKRGLNEPAEVRGVDTVVPHLTGQLAGSRVAHRRVIELRGFIAGTGSDEDAQRLDFADTRETLFAGTTPLFDPTETKTLSATLENGSTATIDCRTINAVWNEIGPAFYTVSIELESVVPNWTITAAGS